MRHICVSGMKRIIVYKWNAYNENIFINQLKINGYDVYEFSYELSHRTRDMKLAQELIRLINEVHPDAVATINYLPIISMVCDTCNIDYYSWVFNSPHLTMFARTIVLPCNHIASFDRKQAQLLQDSGCSTVFHLPLAVDCDKFDTIINNPSPYEENLNNKGCSDVSFVGSLYTEERKKSKYDLLKESVCCNNPDASELERWQRIEDLISRQVFCYEHNYLTDISEDDYYYMIDVLRKNNLTLDEDYFDFNDQVLFQTILSMRVTILERQKLISGIANHCNGKYDFKLYTGSDVSNSKELKWCYNGRVDYEKEMPLVFNRSKINVNITLKSIETGIPLRVLDILGCGGFLLSDPQEELLEYFTEDKEVVIYRSEEECLDKIDYYLKHDDVRNKIAYSGKQAVRSRFSYDKKIKELLGDN